MILDDLTLATVAKQLSWVHKTVPTTMLGDHLYPTPMQPIHHLADQEYHLGNWDQERFKSYLQAQQNRLHQAPGKQWDQEVLVLEK
jgi:hypothetical protein